MDLGSFSGRATSTSFVAPRNRLPTALRWSSRSIVPALDDTIEHPPTAACLPSRSEAKSGKVEKIKKEKDRHFLLAIRRVRGYHDSRDAFSKWEDQP
jgi:hypothetical protein